MLRETEDVTFVCARSAKSSTPKGCQYGVTEAPASRRGKPPPAREFWRADSCVTRMSVCALCRRLVTSRLIYPLREMLYDLLTNSWARARHLLPWGSEGPGGGESTAATFTISAETRDSTVARSCV